MGYSKIYGAKKLGMDLERCYRKLRIGIKRNPWGAALNVLWGGYIVLIVLLALVGVSGPCFPDNELRDVSKKEILVLSAVFLSVLASLPFFIFIPSMREYIVFPLAVLGVTFGFIIFKWKII